MKETAVPPKGVHDEVDHSAACPSCQLVRCSRRWVWPPPQRRSTGYRASSARSRPTACTTRPSRSRARRTAGATLPPASALGGAPERRRSPRVSVPDRRRDPRVRGQRPHGCPGRHGRRRGPGPRAGETSGRAALARRSPRARAWPAASTMAARAPVRSLPAYARVARGVGQAPKREGIVGAPELRRAPRQAGRFAPAVRRARDRDGRFVQPVGPLTALDDSSAAGHGAVAAVARPSVANSAPAPARDRRQNVDFIVHPLRRNAISFIACSWDHR